MSRPSPRLVPAPPRPGRPVVLRSPSARDRRRLAVALAVTVTVLAVLVVLDRRTGGDDPDVTAAATAAEPAAASDPPSSTDGAGPAGPAEPAPPAEGDDPYAEARAFVAQLPSWRLAQWERVARCESQHTWDIATGNGYYGGLQFALESWRGVGGSGRPDEAPWEEQVMRAELLHELQGWAAWPGCARSFGWID